MLTMPIASRIQNRWVESFCGGSIIKRWYLLLQDNCPGLRPTIATQLQRSKSGKANPNLQNSMSAYGDKIIWLECQGCNCRVWWEGNWPRNGRMQIKTSRDESLQRSFGIISPDLGGDSISICTTTKLLMRSTKRTKTLFVWLRPQAQSSQFY